MNPSKNPSALRSKKILTETLLHLMENCPYPEITVKQILLESGISRKTFYRNFLSKDDVLNSHIDAIIYEYLETLLIQETYSFLQMLDIIFSFCEHNKDLLFLLRDNELLYLLLPKLNRLILTEHKRITRNPSAAALSRYIILFNIGGIWNILSDWIENNMEAKPADIKKVIRHYLQNIEKIDLQTI